MITGTPLTLTLSTDKNRFTGTWQVLPNSNNQLFIAVEVKGIKPGTIFGLDLRASKKPSRRESGSIFQPFDNLYRARRAYLSHIRNWAVINYGLMVDLNKLAIQSLMVTYGDPTLDMVAFVELQRRLCPLLDGLVNLDEVSHDRQFRKVVDLIRTTRVRPGPSSRQRLGYTSAAIRAAGRAHDLECEERVVVSLGTVIDQYIGSVLAEVEAMLPVLEDKKALMFYELYTPENRDYFTTLILRLEQLFIVRPFVNPGKHCIRDATEIARIMTVLLPESRGHQHSSMENIRLLIANLVDSFKLLLWQYEFEVVLTWVSAVARLKKGMGEDERIELISRLEASRAKLPEHLGHGFKNNVLPELCMRLEVAIVHLKSGVVLDDLETNNIKDYLTLASNCVGSRPPEAKKVA